MTEPRQSRSRPGTSRQSSPRQASRQSSSGVPPTARGAVLIGILVIAGIVGLQILDDSGASNVKIASTDSTTATTGDPSSTTVALRQPSDVRVKVYNASGVDKQATVMTDKLKALGWATQEPDTISPTRDGTGVQCVAGFESEAASLATAVGQGAAVEPYPPTPPPGADQADCLVILGKV